MSLPTGRLAAAVTLVALPAVLAACAGGGSSTAGAAGPSIAVTAEDKACEVARTGPATFAVTNKGSAVTEVYVYGREGDAYDKVVGEVENIGPGTSRELTADLAAGSYEIACKPGQKGDGIRTRITVAGGSAAAAAPSSSAAAYDREIELATDGRTLTGAPADARVGEKVEWKLANTGGAVRTLEVKEPSGAVAAEIEVAPGETGETVVALDEAGDWRLVLEGDGVADVVTTVPVR